MIIDKDEYKECNLDCPECGAAITTHVNIKRGSMGVICRCGAQLSIVINGENVKVSVRPKSATINE
jgi:aerobic-type carbon monoxide dehydrogenase small subunit (CoxS/CutS family)